MEREFEQGNERDHFVCMPRKNKGEEKREGKKNNKRKRALEKKRETERNRQTRRSESQKDGHKLPSV